jgi:stage II sporulation protein D
MISARAARYVVMLVVLVLGATAACVPLVPPAEPDGSIRIPERVLVRSHGQIVSVPLEDYVLASALAELSPVNETPDTVARLFEVQAVVARSYAVAELGRHQTEGFDFCDGTHCQLYDPARIRTSRFTPAAREAVQATAGIVVTYHGRPAETFFHADCGGYTAAAADVWGGAPIPYLIAAPDVVSSLTHRTWTTTVSESRMRDALNADPRTAVGRRLDGIDVRGRDESGRADEVTIRGDRLVVVAGDQFRAIVDRTVGDRTIDSTRFAIQHGSAGYTFTGSGFGHGVGLCQIGAAARARRGDSFAAILEYYFPGTRRTQSRKSEVRSRAEGGGTEVRRDGRDEGRKTSVIQSDF